MPEVHQYDIDALKAIRQSVDQHIAQAVKKHDRPHSKVLDIAPQAGAEHWRLFSKAGYWTLDIDPKSNPDYVQDLCDEHHDGRFMDAFDCIICTEVLEHVNDPFAAVRNLHGWIKPGGTIYVTTPFNFRIHGPLPDNWRFTEHGLRVLFQHFTDVHIEAVESERFLAPIHYRLTARKSNGA